MDVQLIKKGDARWEEMATRYAENISYVVDEDVEGFAESFANVNNIAIIAMYENEFVGGFFAKYWQNDNMIHIEDDLIYPSEFCKRNGGQNFCSRDMAEMDRIFIENVQYIINSKYSGEIAIVIDYSLNPGNGRLLDDLERLYGYEEGERIIYDRHMETFTLEIDLDRDDDLVKG